MGQVGSSSGMSEICYLTEPRPAVIVIWYSRGSRVKSFLILLPHEHDDGDARDDADDDDDDVFKVTSKSFS